MIIEKRLTVLKTSQNERESKTILDSEFHAIDSGFQVLDSKSFSVGLGFRIPILGGIPYSLSYIPDSISKSSSNSGIWISLHRAKKFLILNDYASVLKPIATSFASALSLIFTNFVINMPNKIVPSVVVLGCQSNLS